MDDCHFSAHYKSEKKDIGAGPDKSVFTKHIMSTTTYKIMATPRANFSVKLVLRMANSNIGPYIKC
jgi:hypothetical protein